MDCGDFGDSNNKALTGDHIWVPCTSIVLVLDSPKNIFVHFVA